METRNHNWDMNELMFQLHVSRSTVYRLIAKRNLPRIKINGRNYFPGEQLDNWLEASDESWNPRVWPSSVWLRRDTRTARAMYKQFNKTFWHNRLPHFDVKVVTRIPDDDTATGECDIEKKCILIDWDMSIDELYFRATLLHEMCHVATPKGPPHGGRFLAQLARLHRMGEWWAEKQLEFYQGDEMSKPRWSRRMFNQLMGISIKAPDLTWDEALKRLAGELSVDPDELFRRFPEVERGWESFIRIVKKDPSYRNKQRGKIEKAA